MQQTLSKEHVSAGYIKEPYHILFKIIIALMKWIQSITISSFHRQMAAAGSCRNKPQMGQFHFAR